MKKLILGILVGVALGFVTAHFWTWRSSATTTSANAETSPAKSEEKPNPLRLTAEKRAANGIILARPTESDVRPEIEAFGRVVDPNALVSAVADVETARTALNASDKELDRIKRLFEAQGNASAQALETAEAAAARDRTALAAARAKLVAGWGRAIETFSGLSHVTEELQNGTVLARIDLLSGQALASDAKVVKVALVGSTDWIDADLLGIASVSDPQLQGMSYLVLLRDHPLPIGAPLRAVLPTTGQPSKTIVISRHAIVYHQGSAWVYVLGEEDTFERKLVQTFRATNEEVTVTGIEPSEQLVVTGAQQLLSAELQAGGAKEED